MATTDAKSGFRLPWSTDRSGSPDSDPEGAEIDTPWPVTDTAQGEAATEPSDAAPAGQTAPPSEEPVSVETPASIAPRRAPAKPTKFLADLTRAMQAAAESAREQTLDPVPGQFEDLRRAHP